MGVLIYVIARGDNMKAHEVSGERLQARAFIADAEVPRNRGVLGDEEFQHAKQRALAA